MGVATLVALLVVALTPVPSAGAQVQIQDHDGERVEEHTEGQMAAPQAAPAEPDDPRMGGRIGAQVGMGMVAGLFVGTIGGFLGAGIGSSACEQDFFSSCGLVGGVVGHYVVALMTIPLAVTWAGSWVDGRGNAGGAYLGELVGAGAAAVLMGVAIAVGSSADGENVAGALYATAFASSIVLPLIGAIVGYEISDDEGRRQDAGLADQGPQLVPLVSADQHRLTIGLGGTF
jgi:hypothetical protein